MLSREVTNCRSSHPNSPSEALAALALSNGGQGSRFDETDAFLLVRQGSMNLPLPEESGVPSTHPDMCIVRIRRNHLVEVSFSLDITSLRASLSLITPDSAHEYCLGKMLCHLRAPCKQQGLQK